MCMYVCGNMRVFFLKTWLNPIVLDFMQPKYEI